MTGTCQICKSHVNNDEKDLCGKRSCNVEWMQREVNKKKEAVKIAEEEEKNKQREETKEEEDAGRRVKKQRAE